MKAIRILLSVVLSLAMALGMVGAYAEPAFAGDVTLRNVVITIGEEEFALGQQANIRVSADEKSAALRFELLNGDKVLLPVAGEIDETGIRFTLDDTGRVYSMDMDMLMGAADMEMDEEGVAALQMITGLAESGAAAVEAIVDPANADAVSKTLDAMGAALTGNPGQEVEMDINGASYAGVQYQGDVSFNNAVAEMDILANSGIAAWEEFVQQILGLFSTALETELSNFADLKAMMLEEGATEEELSEALMQMEMTVGGDDTTACMRTEVTIPGEDPEDDVVISIEEIVTAENIALAVSASAGNGEDSVVEIAFTCNFDLSEGMPVGVEALLDCYAADVYTYEDGYVDNAAVGISIGVNGAQTEGLWGGSMDAAFVNEYSYGYEDSVESYSEEVGFAANLAQMPEEDGTTTAAVELTVAYGDETYGLAFELNSAEGAALAALVGENATVYTLGEDVEDVAYTLLSADAMGLMADAMELAADETIIRLGQKITDMTMSAYEEYAYDDYSYEDAYYEEEYLGDEAYEEVEYTTVYSFEEAAAIYPYAIPGFTAPEGFALSYIDVSTQDLYAEYTTADGYDYIGIYVIDFGMELTEDGAAETAYYDNGEGSLVGAEVISGSTYVSFYFEADTQAEAEAIVAGLSI